MPKKKAPAADMTSLETQVILIINNAPYIASPEEGVRNRDNEQWLLSIPALKISVPVWESEDVPKTGYWDSQQAAVLAGTIWEQCRDPKVLTEYQNNYVWPESFVDGYKIMLRKIAVRPH